MNKIVLCFTIIFLGFTFNSTLASNQNITKDDFDSLVRSNQLEHVNIQKDISNMTGKNKILFDNMSEKLDRVSSNLTSMFQSFEKEQGVAADVTTKISLFTIIISVVLAIITLIISVILALPKKENERKFVRPLQIILIVFIIGTLFGYLPGAITSTNPPKPFDVFNPHSDWLGWVIGITGIIIGILGFTKQRRDSKRLDSRENTLIVDALRKYNHSIQLCKNELIRLQEIVRADIKKGGDGMNVISSELKTQTSNHSELNSSLEKGTIFVRPLLEHRLHDSLNNGMAAFRIVTASDALTRFPDPELWIAKAGESIEMIDHVVEKVETELKRRLPAEQLQ